MKYSKRVALLLAVILLFAAFTGCQSAQNTQSSPPVTSPAATPAPTPAPTVEASVLPAPGSTAISVTDMAGRRVSLDAPANKIVALTASDCEILYAIGAGDTVVGRGEYCDYPAEVSGVPSVQSGNATNIEQIISLKPQLVIMSVMAQTEDQVASLEEAGIKVFASDAQDIAGVYANIELLGKLTGRNNEAATVIGNMKAAFEGVSAKATGNEGKTIYFEVSPLEYGLWTAGSGTFMDEITTMLGMKNAFSDVQGWGQISEEQVIERNPDYIITIAMYGGNGTKPEDEIMGRKGWENVAAIKNKTIYNVDTNELARPGPRLADGANALYGLIYGGGK